MGQSVHVALHDACICMCMKDTARALLPKNVRWHACGIKQGLCMYTPHLHDPSHVYLKTTCARRMMRYFKADKKKGPLPSDEIRKLYNSENGSVCLSMCTLHVILAHIVKLNHACTHACMVLDFKTAGEQVRQLLLKHGDFKSVEVHLKKTYLKEEEQNKFGGWHCVATLTKEGWTELPGCE